MALILVVDDNALNRELQSDLLEMSGYAVRSADSGEAALEAAHRDKPDLILMDVSLPGMDGLTATRLLRQDPATAHIPIIAVSAHTRQSDVEQALQAGCVACIGKPIDVGTFADEVARYLPQG